MYVQNESMSTWAICLASSLFCLRKELSDFTLPARMLVKWRKAMQLQWNSKRQNKISTWLLASIPPLLRFSCLFSFFHIRNICTRNNYFFHIFQVIYNIIDYQTKWKGHFSCRLLRLATNCSLHSVLGYRPASLERYESTRTVGMTYTELEYVLYQTDAFIDKLHANPSTTNNLWRANSKNESSHLNSFWFLLKVCKTVCHVKVFFSFLKTWKLLLLLSRWFLNLLSKYLM